jgi:hypothetical protein
MMITVEGKVIMRLPSTGAKVIKMITYMEMGDTLDRCDIYDTYDAGLSSRPRLDSTSEEAQAVATVDRGPETRAAWARLPRRRRGNTTEAIYLGAEH